jgi:hypothetical protein
VAPAAAAKVVRESRAGTFAGPAALGRKRAALFAAFARVGGARLQRAAARQPRVSLRMADGAFFPTATAVSIAAALHMESVVKACQCYVALFFLLFHSLSGVRYFLMYIFVLS